MDIGEEKEICSKMFEREDFSGLCLSENAFEGCTFIDCNFTDVTFSRCKMIDCEFLNCNLSVVKMDYSKFDEVVFRDSKLLGINWTKVAWPRLVFTTPIKFKNCIISDSSFHGLSLQDLVIENCIAHHVDFRDGDFSGSKFMDTNFLGSLFTGANLYRADLSGATEFDIDIYSTNIKKAKFDRFEAIRLLGYLEIELV